MSTLPFHTVEGHNSPTKVILGSLACFDYIHTPANIESTQISPGRHEFKTKDKPSSMRLNDLIVKYAKDGKTKTVWRINVIIREPDGTVSGVMDDILYNKNMTVLEKKLLLEFDRILTTKRTPTYS